MFPNLAALNTSGKPRADLLAILLTGIPAGLIPGFQNFTGTIQADLMRLNMAIPPSTDKPSILGLLGGDLAGFPNGRRVFDDVFTIELRAIAGATYALVDKTFKPDGPASAVTDGLTTNEFDQTAQGTVKYLNNFPYLGTPHSGYDIPAYCETRVRDRRTAGTRALARARSLITIPCSHRVVRGRSCSTSAAPSARSWCTPLRNSPVSRSSSRSAARRSSSCTPRSANALPGGHVYAAMFAAVRKASTHSWRAAGARRTW